MKNLLFGNYFKLAGFLSIAMIIKHNNYQNVYSSTESMKNLKVVFATLVSF